MKPHIAKLVTIITERVIEPEIIRELDALGAPGYTISDARGKGHRGVRDAGWEHGENIRVEVVCEDRLAQAIADVLRERYYENYAMILFISDVQVLRPEKFSGGKGESP
ncbi:MAG TPA: transcriptional regulator [Planctomycetota bacterium]|jgi:nitrogen regulatory protein PII|nr:transcriptional regulator [Planctomycetota bacterium]